jgi:hypothetical protein
MKKPETIADLKINWTFEEDLGEFSIGTGPQFEKFCELNPEIWKLKIKPKSYNFLYKEITISFYHDHSDLMENLAKFIHWLNYLISYRIKKSFELSHFEKISETIYRIHEKK